MSETDEGPHWTVRGVTGRDSVSGKRGMPKISSLELQSDSGDIRSLTTSPKKKESALVRTEFLAEIKSGNFEFCPICYENQADSDEHVPPGRLGGTVLTKTCTKCNNAFGSRAEAALQDWFDGVAEARLKTVEGHRVIAKTNVVLLTDPDGQAVYFVDTKGGLVQTQPLEGEAGDSTFINVTPPKMHECRLALLKSAYLAAALFLRGVPDCQSANEVREELVAVVRAKSRKDVKEGKHSGNLWFTRTMTQRPDQRSSVQFIEDEDGERKYLISLAGAVLVEWPFPELDPSTVLLGRSKLIQP